MVYIIDYENVTMHGFKGHTSLEADDEVIVFLSPDNKKLDTSFLVNSKASFRFIGITPNGHKNYMDFQITALCAKLANERKKIAIVSNDCGYEAVQDFFRTCVMLDNPTDIKLVSNLQGDPVEKIIPKKRTVKQPAAIKTKSDDTQPAVIETTPKSVVSTPLSEVIDSLPIEDVHKTALRNAIHSMKDKKKGKKMKTKHFIKKLEFLPIGIREDCIKAILPYLDLK